MADSDHSPALRVCTRCQEAKQASLEFFPPHKAGKYGLNSRCIPCKKMDDAERRARPDQQARQKAWRDANTDKVREYNIAYREAGYKSTQDVARWRSRNLEQARQYAREKQRRRRIERPEQCRAAVRKSYAKHRAKIIAKTAERYRTDPWLNMKTRFAVRLRKMLRAPKTRSRTVDVLGFSPQELIEHIERQFTKGMTWGRLLAGEIHIDHIVPVRAFRIKAVGDAEFRACWALSNLRPMWAADNFRKSGKVLTLL